MGILDPGPARSDAPGIRQLAARIRRAGIATSAADLIANVEVPSAAELADLLQTIVAALEASPAPEYEWKGLARVFPPEELAELLNVSVSSLKRYQSGQRSTPDAVAARLHFLALVVGDLAGSYNDIGIRRWFRRKRSQLEGREPAAFLVRDWDADDEGPKRVRELARSLVTLSIT
ncbi:MAG: hypothetical protein AB7P22_01535 [Vicinamibacterales bacterium]